MPASESRGTRRPREDVIEIGIFFERARRDGIFLRRPRTPGERIERVGPADLRGKLFAVLVIEPIFLLVRLFVPFETVLGEIVPEGKPVEHRRLFARVEIEFLAEERPRPLEPFFRSFIGREFFPRNLVRERDLFQRSRSQRLKNQPPTVLFGGREPLVLIRVERVAIVENLAALGVDLLRKIRRPHQFRGLVAKEIDDDANNDDSQKGGEDLSSSRPRLLFSFDLAHDFFLQR